jgi:hypothetical protein
MTYDQAACRERRAFSQDLKSHLVVSSTERHPEPDLRCPLHDREGHHRINAKGGQCQGVARRTRCPRIGKYGNAEEGESDLLESDHGSRIDSCRAECRSQAPGNGRRSGERGRDGKRHPVGRTHPDQQRLQPST